MVARVVIAAAAVATDAKVARRVAATVVSVTGASAVRADLSVQVVNEDPAAAGFFSSAVAGDGVPGVGRSRLMQVNESDRVRLL